MVKWTWVRDNHLRCFFVVFLVLPKISRTDVRVNDSLYLSTGDKEVHHYTGLVGRSFLNLYFLFIY